MPAGWRLGLADGLRLATEARVTSGYEHIAPRMRAVSSVTWPLSKLCDSKFRSWVTGGGRFFAEISDGREVGVAVLRVKLYNYNE